MNASDDDGGQQTSTPAPRSGGETETIEPFGLHFSFIDGFSPERRPRARRLSAMEGMFLDEEARQRRAAADDPVIYHFYVLDEIPETAGDLRFGTSIVYPGTVGEEYHMTKGHFHTRLATAEVYHCLRGRGRLVMENPAGDVRIEAFEPGRAVYVPPRYAHRSVNTGDQPLITFFAFRADAGHDYRTIESKGFRQLVVERAGRPAVIDNPRWRDGSA